eukprot:1177796-Prorocentrum_minimum.AAC.2
MTKGFGRVQLGLCPGPDADDYAPGPRQMYVADSQYGGLEGGDVDTFCVRLPEVLEGKVRVTIAWHDPPALLMSELQLVNDLDLTVEDRSGAQVSPHPTVAPPPGEADRVVVVNTSIKLLELDSCSSTPGCSEHPLAVIGTGGPSTTVSVSALIREGRGGAGGPSGGGGSHQQCGAHRDGRRRDGRHLSGQGGRPPGGAGK